MDLAPIDILMLLGVGVLTGCLGGMLGIGGSIIMIPALAVWFADRPGHNQHLYQASAMAVNVAVAVPAALHHRRAGAIRADLFRLMLPAALVAIVAGVLLSNVFDTPTLKRLFALFLAYVVIDNAVRLVRGRPEHEPGAARVTVARAGTVGGVMGFLAGLLGIGGGGIAVPLANHVCRVPLRQAIGASAAVMGVTATIGAVLKISTLEAHGARWTDAMVLALGLAPTALIGGRLGASLTHRAPIPAIRLVFTVAIGAAALRMAGVF